MRGLQGILPEVSLPDIFIPDPCYCLAIFSSGPFVRNSRIPPASIKTTVKLTVATEGVARHAGQWFALIKMAQFPKMYFLRFRKCVERGMKADCVQSEEVVSVNNQGSPF